MQDLNSLKIELTDNWNPAEEFFEKEFKCNLIILDI